MIIIYNSLLSVSHINLKENLKSKISMRMLLSKPGWSKSNSMIAQFSICKTINNPIKRSLTSNLFNRLIPTVNY